MSAMDESKDVEEPKVEETAAEDGGEAEEVTDLSNSDVTTKYQEAAKIANLALTGVLQQCVAGAKLTDLCKFGDTVITQRCAQIFRNKVKGRAVEKGVAFPTCVSVNECVCNNSPLESEAEAQFVALRRQWGRCVLWRPCMYCSVCRDFSTGFILSEYSPLCSWLMLSRTELPVRHMYTSSTTMCSIYTTLYVVSTETTCGSIEQCIALLQSTCTHTAASSVAVAMPMTFGMQFCAATATAGRGRHSKGRAWLPR
eukprot:10162-Heterococcus_DN1.PRE.2